METETTKPSNPKDMIGGSKLPLHLWPTTATAMGSIGLLNGMLKYGRANWREVGVRSSIYVDALLRHMALWMEGEECDQDDGVPHLSAALACLAIIIDARAAGKLNDDRNYPGGYAKLVDELTPHVARLKELHKDRNPTHYVMGVTTDKQKEDRKKRFALINMCDKIDQIKEEHQIVSMYVSSDLLERLVASGTPRTQIDETILYGIPVRVQTGMTGLSWCANVKGYGGPYSLPVNYIKGHGGAYSLPVNYIKGYENTPTTEVGDFEIAVDEHIQTTVTGYPPDHKARRVIISTWMANTIFHDLWKRPLILLTLGGYPVDVGHKHKDDEWWVVFEGGIHPAGIHSLPEEIMNMKRDTSTPVVLGTIESAIANSILSVVDELPPATTKVKKLWVSRHISTILGSGAWSPVCAIGSYKTSVDDTIKDDEWYIEIEGQDARSYSRKYFTKRVPACAFMGVYARSQSTGEVKK